MVMHRGGPNFLVAGAGRCGTTAIVEGLRSHPQAFVTDPKEPHYFALHGTTPEFAGPGDAHTINRVAVTDKQSYLGLYPETVGLTALGDGSVSTFYYYERALPEVLAMNPEMRLIVLLRDPVARAYSSFQYMRARGFETCEDILTAVEQEPGRRAANWHHLWHYTRMSLYADALEAIRSAVPEKQVGVWFYEDLDRDYGGTMRSVLQFLDLAVPDASGEDDVPRVNVSGTPRSKHLHRALWWATRHETVRSTVKSLTSYHFRERIRNVALRRDAIPLSAREELAPVFAADTARLRSMLPGPAPAWLLEGAPR